MNLDVRQAVLANLNGATTDDVRKTIVDAISLGEEKVLPGLGVLFELLWETGNAEQQNQIVQLIAQKLK